MDYAIIRVGGKQYRVREGETLVVDRLKADEGNTFTPELLLGRVFTVNQAGLVGLQGFGFAAAGALGEVVSPHVAIVVAAVAGLAVVARHGPGLGGPRPPGKPAAEAALL